MKIIKACALFLVCSLLCACLGNWLYLKNNPVQPSPPQNEIEDNTVIQKDYSGFAGGEAILGNILVGAKSALLCTADGLLIYEKNADTPLPMASITKIMSAIIALESIADLSVEVTVPDKAVGIEGSSVYLAKGERVTFEMLLYSALLESANDATTALAILCGGSEESFVAKMNEKAAELSMTSTHFCNPHGLHENEHYTTARDYVKLMSYALENETFCRIIATKKITFVKHDGSMTRVLSNHNRLLNTYSGMLGGKTGYTKTSGRTLITAAQRNGTTLICITLDDGSDWNDHTELFNKGFETVKTEFYSEIKANVPIGAGESESLAVKMQNSISFSTLKNDKITYEIVLPHIAFAPIVKGQIIGRTDFYKNGELIASVPLVAEHAVNIIKQEKGFLEKLRDFLVGST